MSASDGALGMSREQSKQLAASMEVAGQRMQALAESFAAALRPVVEDTEYRMAAWMSALRQSMAQR